MIREIRNLFSYHLDGTRQFAEHDYHDVFVKSLKDLGNVNFEGLTSRKVLDLGCGQRFPYALIAASQGAKVTALDISWVKPESIPLNFYNILKHEGIKRAIKTTIRRLLFDSRYYKFLEVAADTDLRKYKSKIEFIAADPFKSAYPLESNSFDLITSIAVVEHVADIPGFVIELERILKPGGFYYAIIHNFYSLSGGHNLEWAFPEQRPSTKVPPWDHLRGNNFPPWVFLNKYTKDEYLSAFSSKFKILTYESRDIHHNKGGLEGEKFLTPAIEKELSDYPRDLLLSRAWLLICKKN